ncbi:DNA cytosine methyltransferase [Segatella bryantii]|nr:DNA cytosine methyltransferase [Segatella bryantii]UKK72118.1 DNA cytosine methyltransferase [Segatella bryantii]
MAKEVIKFIDLFAGIGGIRLGLELALRKFDKIKVTKQ